ncbi:hypothetical protein H6G04_27030 [Calothrix membranacea FACHB-236]|nr:hypothetical protein [Calothrix membranacea FACHB-236]
MILYFDGFGLSEEEMDSLAPVVEFLAIFPPFAEENKIIFSNGYVWLNNGELFYSTITLND